MFKMDSQQTEIAGRSIFIGEAVRHGLEVAEPARDHGVDLILYNDDPQTGFMAVPVQLKVSTTPRFGLDKKYEKFSGLIIANVWLSGPWDDDGQTHIYMLNYNEALGVLGDACKTASWMERNSYSFSNIGKDRRAVLEPFRNRWSWVRDLLGM